MPLGLLCQAGEEDIGVISPYTAQAGAFGVAFEFSHAVVVKTRLTQMEPTLVSRNMD